MATKSKAAEAAAQQPAPHDQQPQQGATPGQSPKTSPILQAIGRDVLAKNPKLEAIYVTSDGYVHTCECDAINSARTLKNNHVETVKREA